MAVSVFHWSPAYPVPTNAVEMRVNCTNSDWRSTQVVLTAAPLGSDFETQVGSSLAATKNGWTFTADRAGIYHFTVNALDANGLAISGETTSFELYIGHRLTKELGADEDPAVPIGTLVVYVWDDHVRETPVDTDHPEYAEVTPRVDPHPSSPLSRAAVQSAGVVAAAAALVDQTSATVSTTLLPLLETAYVAALGDPGAIDTENPGAVYLIDEAGFK